MAGRFRVERAPRLAAPRAEAFFLAGRRVDVFFVAFLADFLADFAADFFADFFADVLADFFEDFFVDFREAWPPELDVDFLADVDFPDELRAAAGRERELPAVLRAADEPLSRIDSEAVRFGMEAGLEKAGAGGTGGGRGSDMGLSSIHPPLVQPVSISSDPDIGAPCAQRGATRRRFRPPGPW